MNIAELRKHAIGPFKDLKEMRKVHERLLALGESRAVSTCLYPEYFFTNWPVTFCCRHDIWCQKVIMPKCRLIPSQDFLNQFPVKAIEEC